jgi:nucleotide-binding universal stress UspA family protein
LHALDYAIYLCHAWSAHLLLIHSIHGVRSESGSFGQAELKLRSLVASTNVTFDVVVGYRPAAEMILKTSREVAADVIVMGVHPGPPSSDHVPWAVAHRVVCSAPCPVLTVRASSQFNDTR